ncbi:DUF6113 family protein [Streptomyces aidingensis]|uniref:Integral membrane protein n=1 Tax=Streptomyces aidingensis TaxID=910347 RepID=A0A1I1EUX1_9ACTN|nr:DUF6113 family protein [Streptomyces aidingensis]SFB90456.1 hypothetical protein SAMN05421773_101460 [Streptomyces aidingensis]
MSGMTAGRLAAHLLLAALGALVAAAGALVQAGWFPLGVLLALAGAAALFLGGALVMRTKAGAGVPAVGWAVTVMVLNVPRPQGDFLFAAGAASYLFLFGGMMTAVLCAMLAPTDRPLFSAPPPSGRGK